MKATAKKSQCIIGFILICVASATTVNAQEMAVTEVVGKVTVQLPSHPEAGAEYIVLPSSEVEKLREEYETLNEPPMVYVPENAEKRSFMFRWVDKFVDWFKKEPPVKEGSSSQALREQWAEMLGADVFYPIFKAKEAQKAIRKKCSVRVYGMRATADYSDGKVWLKFKRKW